jgi:hypothetical protein
MTPLNQTLTDIALGNTYSEQALVTALHYTDKPAELQTIVRYIKGTNTTSDGIVLQWLANRIYQAQKETA